MTLSAGATATRKRLVEAAGECFYRRGVHRSNVDDLVAAAGLTKPTLYEYFRSKHELLVAAMRQRSEGRKRQLLELVDGTGGGPEARLRAIFADYEDVPCRAGFRGCPLVISAVETPEPEDPVRTIAKEYKEWTRALLERLAREAGLAEPEELARSLVLLIEGASVTAYVEGRPEVGQEARRAAGRLIDAHRGAGATTEPSGS